LGLGKRQLETIIQELKQEHKTEAYELKTGYDMAIKEMSESIKEMQEAYENKIRELNNETKNLWEVSRQKDSEIREKNYHIKELNKGMEMGNQTTAQLQEELNRFKDLYFKLRTRKAGQGRRCNN